jgi:hypothetical protein
MITRIPTDGLNVASRGNRVAGIVWVLLTVAFALAAISAYALTSSLDRSKTLLTRMQELNAEQARMDALAAKQKSAFQSTSNKALLKAEQDVSTLAGVNWDAVLNALEAASYDTHGGVTILSLGTTQVQAGRVGLNITALANNSQSMLSYVQHLSAEPIAISTEIVHQQPDNKVAPEGHKFQMLVVFDPSHLKLHSQQSPPITEVRNARANQS